MRRMVLRVVLCCCLAAGVGIAQRHGGGGFSGGFRGGGGGFGGGGFRGGGGFGGGGFRGGFGGGFRGFGGRGFGFRGRGFGFGGGFGWPFYYGGFGYWPGYYGYPYDSGYGYGYDPYAYSNAYPASSYAYPASSAYYPASQPASNVTVIYPPQQSAPSPVVVREYDEYGQEVRRAPAATGGANSNGGSPIYLIAFKDHTIKPAAAYWVEANTLHYVTLERQQIQVSLDSVDRPLSEQLNRERGVEFLLTEK